MKKTVILLLALGFAGFPGLLLARDYLVEGVDSRSSMEICMHPTAEQKHLIEVLLMRTDVPFALHLQNPRAACKLVFERRQSVKLLKIRNGLLYDLSPLKDWVHLEALDLIGTQVKDLRPLVNLVNLRELNLMINDVESLDPLRGLIHLESLSLDENEIEDLSPLENLKVLTDLNVSRNHITDLSVVRGLPKLQILYYRMNPVVDLSPLEGRNFQEVRWPKKSLFRE